MHWKTLAGQDLYRRTADNREFHDLKASQGLGYYMYLVYQEYANCRMDVAE